MGLLRTDGYSLSALLPAEAHRCSAPLFTTFTIGTALVFTNHGVQVVAGKFPAWWVVGLTYALVYCAFAVGGVCSKLRCSYCMRRMLGVPMHQHQQQYQPGLKTFNLSEVEEGNGDATGGVEFEESGILFPGSACGMGDMIGSGVEDRNGKSIYARTQGGKENRNRLYLEDCMMGTDESGYRSLLMRDECGGATPPTKNAPIISCESSRSNKIHESASSFGLIDMPGMFEASDFQGIEPRIFLTPELGEAKREAPEEQLPGLGKPDYICQPGESDIDAELESSWKADRSCHSNARLKACNTGSHRSASMENIGVDKIRIRRSQSTDTKTFLTAPSTRQVFVYKNALFLDNLAEFDDIFDGQTIDAGGGDEDNWKHMPHST